MNDEGPQFDSEIGLFFSSLPPVFLFLQERFKDHFPSCILEIIKAWELGARAFLFDVKEQLLFGDTLKNKSAWYEDESM